MRALIDSEPWLTPEVFILPPSQAYLRNAPHRPFDTSLISYSSPNYTVSPDERSSLVMSSSPSDVFDSIYRIPFPPNSAAWNGSEESATQLPQDFHANDPSIHVSGNTFFGQYGSQGGYQSIPVAPSSSISLYDPTFSITQDVASMNLDTSNEFNGIDTYGGPSSYASTNLWGTYVIYLFFDSPQISSNSPGNIFHFETYVYDLYDGIAEPGSCTNY